jgi:hypothetical protein
MKQINLFQINYKKILLYSGWILFFLCLWFKGCSNGQKVSNNEVVIKEITKTLPSDTIVKNVPIEIEKWYKDQKAENKLKTDIKEIYIRLQNYQEETEWMQEEFAHKDSLQKAELYRLATALKSFESNFEDEYLKLKINGILAGGEVKEITPTYTLKERKVNVPQTKFRLLAGGGLGLNKELNQGVYKFDLGFQNAKGNIIETNYLNIGGQEYYLGSFKFSILNIKK